MGDDIAYISQHKEQWDKDIKKIRKKIDSQTQPRQERHHSSNRIENQGGKTIGKKNILKIMKKNS